MRKIAGSEQQQSDAAETMRLEDLGQRICILGPSNSGKSTLASAIGRKCGLTVIHLDQLYHRPGTDWEPRPGKSSSACTMTPSAATGG